jgi:hypothetical protein
MNFFFNWLDNGFSIVLRVPLPAHLCFPTQDATVVDQLRHHSRFMRQINRLNSPCGVGVR